MVCRASNLLLTKNNAGNSECSQGFTLIEILLVIGLVGIIASVALVPLVFTVRSLEDAQARWGRRHNVRDAADAIFRDIRLAIKNPSFPSVKIIHKEGLKSDSGDSLLVWSASPKYEGKSAGVVAYRVIPEDSFSDAAPGLYRWVICGQPSLHASSGDVFAASSADVPEPMDIDPDDLEAEDGELILSTARSLRFYFPHGDEWERETYNGGVPKIQRVEITLEEKTYVRTERLVNAEE